MPNEPEVRVHLNLHTREWTVSTLQRKKIDSQPFYCLTNVRFVVSEATRQWVLRRKERCVHAWAIGTKGDAVTQIPHGAVEVTYSPFRAATFTTRDGNPVLTANACYFIGQRAYIV